MTSQGNATFSADGKELEFPLVPAVEGCSGYDISSLMKETGNVTLDVGFVKRRGPQREAPLFLPLTPTLLQRHAFVDRPAPAPVTARGLQRELVQ